MLPPPLLDFPALLIWGGQLGKSVVTFPWNQLSKQGLNRDHSRCMGRTLSSQAFGANFENACNVPWHSCLRPLSQVHREVKVLPRAPPKQSSSNFRACSLNPAMLAILPLSCSLLPTSCSFLCATFHGFTRKERRFFFPLFASLHYSHLFIQALSPFVFRSRVELGSLFALWDALLDKAGVGRRSGSQASTRGGGNVPLQINQNFLLQKC